MITAVLVSLVIGSVFGYGIGCVRTEEKHHAARMALLWTMPDRIAEAQRADADAVDRAADELLGSVGIRRDGKIVA